MSVNRRTAIRQFLFVSAGVVLLPSCLHDKPGSTVPLKNFSVSGDQERLLAILADTLIPTGQTAGAATVSAHLFALKMLDDCHTKEQQQKFLKGLQQLDETCASVSGHRFAEATPSERAALFTMIENKKTTDELTYCYGEMKRLTIQAYTTSQFFLTKVHIYELVPGRWHGCVPVGKTPNKTA